MMTDPYGHDPHVRTLDEFVGVRTLEKLWRGQYSRSDFGLLDGDERKHAYRDNDEATHVILQLDGKLWCFQEDPSDGWRSSLRVVKQVRIKHGHPLASSLALVHPPMVLSFRTCCACFNSTWSDLRLADKYESRPKGQEYFDCGEPDLLYAVNERTGLVVLEIGTILNNDYYPSFHFEWNGAGWMPAWLQAR